MTVKCSDSANNDDLNVKVVNISLFIKHGESFKRLFTYNTDESRTSSRVSFVLKNAYIPFFESLRNYFVNK